MTIFLFLKRRRKSKYLDEHFRSIGKLKRGGVEICLRWLTGSRSDSCWLRRWPRLIYRAEISIRICRHTLFFSFLFLCVYIPFCYFGRLAPANLLPDAQHVHVRHETPAELRDFSGISRFITCRPFLSFFLTVQDSTNLFSFFFQREINFIWRDTLK
jgi:hypothetical protein